MNDSARGGGSAARVTPPSARALDPLAAALTVVLCLSWGLNQVAIKIAVADIPPLMQAAARSAGALVLIVAWCRWRGIALFARDRTLVPGLVAGVLFATEFALMYGGLQFTSASRSALFLYTAPFFVALGARWFLAERLNAMQWSGLVLSFIGAAIAMGGPTSAGDPRMVLGDFMLIGAGAAWAATTLTIKATRLVAVAPEKTLVYQIAVSAPLLVVGSIVFGEPWPVTASALSLACLAYQTVGVVAVTYLLWFGMVQRYSASRLSAFTFLTPLFGIGAGHLLLGDPLTPPFAVAVVLVVAGLVLVNRPK